MFYHSVTLILLITSCTFSFGKMHNQFSDSVALYELPTSEVLPDYVRALEEIVNFAYMHKNLMDMNFIFGIFLVHANIKFLMEREAYIARLDPSYNTLLDIMSTSQEVLNWFWIQVEKYERTYEDTQYAEKARVQVRLTRLFYEEGMWIDEMRNFNNHEIGRVVMNSKAFFKRFQTFNDYITSIRDINSTLPSPHLSDQCLSELVGKPLIIHGEYKKCSAADECLEMLQHGTNYGYSLTHRLFFLLFARYTRRCKVFSETEDKGLVQKLCSIAYNEAIYISDNNYGDAIDLVMEQIAICTLHGYPEFLNRKMLAHILSYQTEYGCFANSLPLQTARPEDTIDPEWTIGKDMNHTILGGVCNGHATSVASASLALAVRFILETAHSH